jgi:hypothetical protein
MVLKRRFRVKDVNLEFIKGALTELDPTLEDGAEDDSYRTALVLVSALVHGRGH